MPELCFLTAPELRAALGRREVSAREVLAAHLDQIERVNPAVNAVITLHAERATAAAAAADERAAAGADLPPLHGLPVAHKDLHETAGLLTTYGSPVRANYVPAEDALVIERMRQAGVITIGKTNVPEFGAGSHTFNPLFGATRNPYDRSKSAGGSSGGTAAALACGMHPIGDGSDMGGSLRNPASFNNVVGFRPSPGRVPGWPALMAWGTMGVSGPMARTVADVALLLAVQSGPDPRAPFALDAPPPALASPAQAARLVERDVTGLRVAWSPDLGLPVDPDVRATLAPARQVLIDLGCEVIDAAPDLSGADEAFRILRASQFVRAYGALVADHPDQVGPNVTWNVEEGRKLTIDDLRRAGDLQAAVARQVTGFFAGIDVLACPVSQVAPFDVTADWVREVDGVPQLTYIDWMASCYRITMTGLPAISVP